MGWMKLTDSVRSLPPTGIWLLVALPREGGVVVEAVFEGNGNRFRLRDGRTYYDAVAWDFMPKYPKELE